jgi:glycosyltransferase involved in cell wall biosynthesis
MDGLAGGPAGAPTFDELMRWIREDLDARPGGGGETAAMGAPTVVAGSARSSAGTPAGRASRIALVTMTSGRGEFGGAERLYEGLHAALVERGVAAERVDVVGDERDVDAILRSYLRCYDLDLSAFDGVISTKAPSYAVRHRNHVCYLPHTMRTFYDMFEVSFPEATAAQRAQRDLLRRLDAAALSRPSLRALCVVGAEVSERLRACLGIDGEVLHHPTTQPALRSGGFRHLLLPGRLHRWKRVDLALDAVRRMRHAVELVISGTGEDELRLRALARGMPGVRFAGHVADAELAGLYANALAVLHCPIREDYGLVTVEAFGSGKPVVTCSDSGEPARLVVDGVTGFICPPDPAAIAARLDRLVADPALAEAMGRRGREVVAPIGWDRVCGRLLGGLGLATEAA